MKVKSMFLDGEILGSYLASLFSLNRQYFSRAFKEDCKINVEMRELHGFVFVKVPENVRYLIDSGYVARRIVKNDTINYEFKFELSKNCTIGFWR